MLEANESSGVRDIILPPKPAHDLNHFFTHLHTRAGRKTQDFKFMLLSRLFGASVADAEIDAAGGEPVQARELVCE
jgi:hypothetical protein